MNSFVVEVPVAMRKPTITMTVAILADSVRSEKKNCIS